MMSSAFPGRGIIQTTWENSRNLLFALGLVSETMSYGLDNEEKIRPHVGMHWSLYQEEAKVMKPPAWKRHLKTHWAWTCCFRSIRNIFPSFSSNKPFVPFKFKKKKSVSANAPN